MPELLQVRELYQRYFDIEKAIKELGDPAAPDLVEAEQNIQRLEGELQDLQKSKAEADERAAASQADAALLLGLTKQLCQQRGAAQAQLASAELKAVEAEARLAELEKQLSAQAEQLETERARATKQAEEVLELTDRLQVQETEFNTREAALEATIAQQGDNLEVTRADMEERGDKIAELEVQCTELQSLPPDVIQQQMQQLKAEINTAGLECERHKANASREAWERTQERLQAQARENQLGQLLAEAQDMLTRRGGEQLETTLVKAFEETQASLKHDKAALNDAESCAERIRTEAQELISGYQQYAGTLENALAQATAKLSNPATDRPPPE